MYSTTLFRTLLTSTFMLAITAAAASAQGRIEVVGGDTYNWGTVAPGELKAAITVKNVGNQALTISHVQPGCGCTSSPIDRNHLEPGETGTVNVVLHANGSGPIHKIMTIHSDAPGDTAHVVHLAADLRTTITFEPANYFLVNEGTVRRREEKSLTIVNSGTETITIYPPDSATANARVEFPMTKAVELAPGGRLELKARITPSAVGPISGEIKVRTSAKDNPVLTLKVFGNAVAATPVKPSVVKKTPVLSSHR
jgi:hypothetical protein